MIKHGVVFTLKKNSPLTQEQFFSQALKLKKIDTVVNFEVVKETSPKNDFDFGLFMNFKNPQAYEFYNNHPDHVKFVEEIWLPNVEEFMEIDYEKIL
ncbi:hypothetical protein LNTAR_09404 [Lentisphaera araneosa HTCC2155]|jgi:hypothetical protein|uniref:Stress-response A/B barrel domain-containing protein n=1 Tax=Lentisphaera araneosa HTCC2155 TaxID=313628 RepID=A6DIC2_9BACT|nr:Dabb family protein [Lentisphaera araneosa]EDM28776.1 hypothetical protein LNTAR_09404 [Lentisphaera araneosa HTCC2155]